MQRLALTLAACALLGLLALSLQAVLVRGDEHSAYEHELNRLPVAGHHLIAEVLRARAGAVSNYDHIAQAEAALYRTQVALRRPPELTGGQGMARLRAALNAADETRRSCERLIERFKSEHAVLQNSLRALSALSSPTSLTSLTSPTSPTSPTAPTSRDSGGASIAGADDDLVQHVVRDVLLLQHWHEPTTEHRLTTTLAQLTARREAGLADDRDLALIERHAMLGCDRGRMVQHLVDRLLAQPLQGRAREVLSAYSSYRSSAAASADRLRIWTFGFALLSVVSIALYVNLRLRGSAEALRASRGQLEQAFEGLRIEQQKQSELAELKTRFVATTSHEFRTPLSIIVSSSEMLAAYDDRWSAERKSDHLGRIRSSALDMTRMLENILLIGKSDAGMLLFEPEPVELSEFCHEVIEATEQGLGQAGRTHFRGPAGTQEVLIDERLLHHVLSNLLANAIKYSPGGDPVQFEVELRAGDLVFEIRDRGIGIPESDRARLFETFHRGGNVGKIAGTGLGLAIVKRSVDLHGGSISVHSEVGAGTRFTVRIPGVTKAAA